MHVRRSILTIMIITLCANWPALGHDEDQPESADDASAYRVIITRASEPPEIDGVLDDAAWADAVIFDNFTQVDPDEGDKPTHRTAVHLIYDDDNLYIAVRCDQPGDTIIGTTMQRDGSQSADDRITVVLDTFLDRRNGFSFQMNPRGARTDALVDRSDRLREDWDGIWRGRSSIDDAGWSCELAIPFKTVNFDPGSNTWGFNVERRIRHLNETVRWSSPRRNTPIISMSSAGQISGLDNMDQGIGLDLVPFAVASAQDIDGEQSIDLDAGLDLFYNITPSLTASLSFNTDFAETEVDARRVNLTRFPLFFPEKRDFFLRDESIFRFAEIGRNPLPFFSRRIGIGPGGQQQDILVGAKLTGRINDINLGLLNVLMKDDPTLGQKNLTVGRASVNVLEESQVGAIFTAGNPNGSDENIVGGVDFVYRNSNFNGDQVVRGSAFLLRSETEGENGRQMAFGGRLAYPNDRVRWDVGFTQIDDDFNASLGFVPRRGIREYFGGWRYRWRPRETFRRIDSGVRGSLVTNTDDQIESGSITLEPITLEFDSNDVIEFSTNIEREQIFSPFEISDGVIIPTGEYDFISHRASFRTSSARPVSFGVSGRVGEFWTGDRWDASANVQWRASESLFFSVEFEFTSVDLPEGSFITRILRSRANVFFTPDIAWTNFIQYDNVSETAGLNSRLRWIIRPGSELFVVLNQGFAVTTDRFDSVSTELTTKLGWTLRF